MVDFVETSDDRAQNVIFASLDNIIRPTIELVIRSINGFSRRDVASITAVLEPEEHIGIAISFKKVFKKSNTFHELNMNDETPVYVADGMDETLVPFTHFD